MPKLVGEFKTAEDFDSNKASSLSAHDLESNGIISGPLVSLDAKDMYVHVGSASAEELDALGVPTCCSNSCSWFTYCTVCCLLTVILPLAIFLPLSGGSGPLFIVAIVLVVVGVAYVIFSLRVTLWDGGVAMPAGPPPSTAFSETSNSTAAAAAAGGGGGGDMKHHHKTNVKKIYVIVNPHGGLKLGPRALQEVCLPIWEKEFGMEVTVLETEYAGHARDYARTVQLDGYDGLCVIGGDGSIHEVINGLLQRDMKGEPLIPVGFLPGGSGNSILLDLGTWSMAEAARRIGRGDVMWTDVVTLNTMGKTLVSYNLIAWGLLGDVGVIAEFFRMLGTARYDVVGVWTVLKGGGDRCKLTYEHEGSVKTINERMVTGCVNNTQHFGKGLRAFPKAKLNDGLMDLYYLSGESTRGELLTIFQQLPSGSHLKSSWGKTMFQSKGCKVELGKHGVVNVDGEIVKHDGTMVLKTIPNILPIFAPPTYEPPTVPQAAQSKIDGWMV